MEFRDLLPPEGGKGGEGSGGSGNGSKQASGARDG